jgi:hypothetical protein
MVAVVAGLLVIIACSGAGDDDQSTSTAQGASTTAAVEGGTTATDLPSCADTAHAAVFDLSSLSIGTQELAKWIADFDYDMVVRPGAVELVNAFVARGYRIVYLTALASNSTIGPQGSAMSAEITNWQRRHGFPTGEGTTLLMWDQENYADANTYRVDAMVQLTLGGTALDFGYTDDENDVRAFRNAGMPVERIFTVQGSAGSPGTAGVPQQDWVAHKATVVDPLPPICRR